MFVLKTKLPFSIYIISTIFGFFCWVLWDLDLCHFLGAASLIYSLLLSVTAVFRWIAYVSLIWCAAFPLSLIVTFVILLKKNLFRPIIFVIGADLCFSLFVMIYKCIISNYVSFAVMLSALVFRTLYYAYLIYHVKNIERNQSIN